MDPLIAYGLISGVGSIASGLANTGLSYGESKALMKYQYQLQQDAIDRANLYNSPAEQMKRLAAAQLNPNLVYGHGVDGNQSGAASPSVVNRTGQLHNPLQDMGQAYLDSKRLEMEKIANRNAAFESRERQLNLRAKTIGQLIDNSYQTKTLDTRIKAKSQELANSRQELLNAQQKLSNMVADEALTWSKARNEDNRMEQIWEETNLIRAKTGLTQEQALTESVKRALYRSNIQVNNAKIDQIASMIAFIDEGTNLRELEGKRKGLDFDVEKAYKEWKAKHPGATATIDAFKEAISIYRSFVSAGSETMNLFPSY